MSKIDIRFAIVFGILAGLASAVFLLQFLGQFLIPGIFGAFPGWLPEDALKGLGFKFFLEIFQWYPALVFSAILLTFSFWIRPEELPAGENKALVRFSLVAVFATVVFALVELLAQPWDEAQLETLTFRYTQTRQLEDAYLKIKTKGSEHQTPTDLDARLNLLKRLGQLRPNQGQMGGGERMDYDFELQILKAHFDLDEFFRLRALPGVLSMEADPKLTVDELLDMAEKALADGTSDREYLANLWGYTVYRRLINFSDQGKAIDVRILDRAKTVVDQSWGRIYEKTLAADERQKASYFFRKGKSLGDFQFQNYLEAYYGFQELHRENPRDVEVVRYEEIAREKIAGQVLFAQEMDVLFAVPGSENLVFLNRESAPTEVVRVGKLLNTSQGVYLKDFEFLRYTTGGKILLHWTAPYGRWTEEGIDFRVWDKDNPVPRFPLVLAETPGNEFNPANGVDPPKFLPRVTVRDLELVNAKRPRPQTLGTWDLLVHGQYIEALGYNSRLFQTEFVVRLAAPFGFFVVFLLVFSLAWHHRTPGKDKTWWFLFPILPLVAEFISQTFEWGSRLVVGGLLQFLGLGLSEAVLAVVFLGSAFFSVSLVRNQFHKSLQHF